ncbi:MAG TPA: tetratricopeptide repeat protein [Vicinamibacterales bacterium]
MTIFVWDGWAFDPEEWRLTSAARGVMSMPNRTLELLALLLDRAPRLVSKDEILAVVWRESVVEEGNIAFHIAMLRKMLDEPGRTSCIETVRGRGYRFVAPVGRREPAAEQPASVTSRPPFVEPVDESSAALSPSAAAPAPPLRRWHPAHLVPLASLASAATLMGWVAMAAPQASIRDVAVLPVVVHGEGQEIAGAADAIATGLARLEPLTARTAEVEALESPASAGRRLGAESVLRTTVDRSRTPWRVTAELARSRDGLRIWGWTFDVPADASGAPEVIAARVADGLGRHLGAEAAPRGTASAEARALSLRARERWRLRTPPSVQQAIALYERAIAIDPSYAPAYAGLADCYNLTVSGLPVSVRAVNAKANAERALALDPGLAEAQTSLAFYLYKFEWKWEEAEARFRRAIAADPSYAQAHHWYGEMIGYFGRFDEAIAELRQAHALDPTSLAIIDDLAGPLLRSGRVEEARAVVETGAAINPMYHGIPKRRAEILAAEGRERESLEEAWRAAVLTGATMESVEELRAAYRAGGLPAVLRIEIARLEGSGGDRFAVPAQATFLASRYARLRDKGKALYWIGVAIDRREDIALHLPTYPEYDWLRGDPEFARMLERVELKPLSAGAI